MDNASCEVDGERKATTYDIHSSVLSPEPMVEFEGSSILHGAPGGAPGGAPADEGKTSTRARQPIPASAPDFHRLYQS
jgi:hypothetical protein